MAVVVLEMEVLLWRGMLVAVVLGLRMVLRLKLEGRVKALEVEDLAAVSFAVVGWVDCAGQGLDFGEGKWVAGLSLPGAVV